MVNTYTVSLSSWHVLMAYTGFSRFLILGSVSGAIYLVGVRKIPNSTVIPLKARKYFLEMRRFI